MTRSTMHAKQPALAPPRRPSPLRRLRRGVLLGVLSVVVAACASPAGGPASPATGGSAGVGGGTRPAKSIVMMTSGGFASVSDELKPGYERASGNTVRTVYGSSMGGASDSIPSRLDRNEPADLVVLARNALDQLVKQGKVVPGTEVDLVHSPIGFVVRKGEPKPDLSSTEAVRRTLLAAPSIAYSASASGTYFETELLKKLGVEQQVKPKSKRIVSERVGTVVARGDAALGLQQVSELLPIPGVDFVGVLPPELQRVTVFSAGITTTAREPAAARDLIEYFRSPAAAPVIRKGGLEPAPPSK